MPAQAATPLGCSLRLKVLLALGVAGLGLMLVLAAWLPTLIVARFDRQEQERMRGDTQRVGRALTSELEGLATFVLNWSVWDETYAYVQRPTRSYEQSNLTPTTFLSAGVNLFVFLTPRGEVVSAWQYDLLRGRFVPAGPVTAEVRRFWDVLGRLPTLTSVQAGLVALPGGPWLLAARPIVTSAGRGPAAGVMVMGKQLTPAVLQDLKRDARLTLTVQAAGPLPPGAGPPGQITLRVPGETQLEGQTRLLDLRGRPSLLLRVGTARTDHANGVVAARTILWTVLALVLLFLGLTTLLIERLMLRRLAGYRRQVRTLQGSPAGQRFTVEGRDELSALGEALNQLLDSTERHQQQLLNQAYRDDLTGLPNRRCFRDRLGGLLARARPFAVVLLDLNDFKAINDTLGHETGDEVLRRVAERLRKAVDPREELVARLGGDEFALLLPQAEGAAVMARVHALLGVLGPPLQAASGGQLFVSASAGVSLWGGAGHGPDGDGSDLLKYADLAMYRAKASGAAAELYTSSLSEAAQQRAQIGRDLRGALTRGEFHLVYQPVVALDSGTAVGCEALLRWEPGGRGPVSPQVFVPVAEETGMISDIGRWVLSTACAQAAAWWRAGRSLRVAVNVSAVQLRGGNFAAEVAACLDEHGLPPDLLELEVTETAVLADLPSAVRQLTQVRALGVAVALDDFGTGHSSLELVRELPLDKLKLDRSFLREVEADRRRQVIFSSVVRMAGDLGLQVVAEGVETPEQVALLRGWRCPQAQGSLYARPLAPGALWGWMLMQEAGPSPEASR